MLTCSMTHAQRSKTFCCWWYRRKLWGVFSLSKTKPFSSVVDTGRRIMRQLCKVQPSLKVALTYDPLMKLSANSCAFIYPALKATSSCVSNVHSLFISGFRSWLSRRWMFQMCVSLAMFLPGDRHLVYLSLFTKETLALCWDRAKRCFKMLQGHIIIICGGKSILVLSLLCFFFL